MIKLVHKNHPYCFCYWYAKTAFLIIWWNFEQVIQIMTSNSLMQSGSSRFTSRGQSTLLVVRNSKFRLRRIGRSLTQYCLFWNNRHHRLRPMCILGHALYLLKKLERVSLNTCPCNFRVLFTHAITTFRFSWERDIFNWDLSSLSNFLIILFVIILRKFV